MFGAKRSLCVSTSHAAMRMMASAALISRQVSTWTPSVQPSIHPFGLLCWVPLPSDRRGSTFTGTATPWCTGISPRIQLTSNSARAVSTAITVTPYDFQQTASAIYRALVHPCPGYDLQNHLAFLDLQITGGSQGLQHLRYRRPCRRRVRGVPVVHRHAQNFVFHGKPRDPNTRNSLLNFFQEAIRDLHHVFLLFSSGLLLFQPVISDIRHTLQANHLP